MLARKQDFHDTSLPEPLRVTSCADFNGSENFTNDTANFRGTTQILRLYCYSVKLNNPSYSCIQNGHWCEVFHLALVKNIFLHDSGVETLRKTKVP